MYLLIMLDKPKHVNFNRSMLLTFLTEVCNIDRSIIDGLNNVPVGNIGMGDLFSRVTCGRVRNVIYNLGEIEKVQVKITTHISIGIKTDDGKYSDI